MTVWCRNASAAPAPESQHVENVDGMLGRAERAIRYYANILVSGDLRNEMPGPNVMDELNSFSLFFSLSLSTFSWRRSFLFLFISLSSSFLFLSLLGFWKTFRLSSSYFLSFTYILILAFPSTVLFSLSILPWCRVYKYTHQYICN